MDCDGPITSGPQRSKHPRFTFRYHWHGVQLRLDPQYRRCPLIIPFSGCEFSRRRVSIICVKAGNNMTSASPSLRNARFIRIILLWFAVCLILAFSMVLNAQSKTDAVKAPPDAHAADFDYLLGDWEFSGVNVQYGKLHGYWSVARLNNPRQIVDEYRVVGPKGEIYYSTTTLRSFNDRLDEWELVSMEDGSGLQNVGTGRKEGSEMHITQKFMGPNGSFSTLRIRYFDIGADNFRWTADRSSDDGKTWTKNFQTLEVKRIGPARILPSLIQAGTNQGH